MFPFPQAVSSLSSFGVKELSFCHSSLFKESQEGTPVKGSFHYSALLREHSWLLRGWPRSASPKHISEEDRATLMAHSPSGTHYSPRAPFQPGFLLTCSCKPLPPAQRDSHSGVQGCFSVLVFNKFTSMVVYFSIVSTDSHVSS